MTIRVVRCNICENIEIERTTCSCSIEQNNTCQVCGQNIEELNDLPQGITMEETVRRTTFTCSCNPSTVIDIAEVNIIRETLGAFLQNFEVPPIALFSIEHNGSFHNPNRIVRVADLSEIENNIGIISTGTKVNIANHSFQVMRRSEIEETIQNALRNISREFDLSRRS